MMLPTLPHLAWHVVYRHARQQLHTVAGPRSGRITCLPMLQVAVSNADNPGQVAEVAACLGGSSTDAPTAALPVVAGTLYCCMPLPFTGTGLPLHVHGTWALQSNRRELWTNIDDERKLVQLFSSLLEPYTM